MMRSAPNPHLARTNSGFTPDKVLVFIAMIAILTPIFARARENARKTTCENNLKFIGGSL